jgi:hypothetical protein
VGYRVKENGVEYKIWTKVNPIYNSNSKTYTATVELTGLDYQASYTIQADIHDTITTYVYSKAITKKATPVFDWSGEDFNFNVPISFNNTPMTDFVLEQGIMDNWHYRKWNSGYAECWKIATVSGINASEKNYSGFWYSNTQYLDLPFKFINYPVVQVDGGSSNYMNFVRKFGSQQDKIPYVVVSMTPDATNISINIDCYAFGKWR